VLFRSGSLAIAADVTVAGEVERIVAETVAAYGALDVLINNAGEGLHVPLEELDPADLRAVFELNVIAPLLGMQAVLPVMRARSGGAIINVSSATSLRTFPGLGGYAATKSALNMVSQVARLEFASAGVSVSVVYPALTATEFHDRLRAGHFNAGAGRIPSDPPELVSAAIAFAIRTGDAHVMVADPPRPIALGGGEDWGTSLAKGPPRGPQPPSESDDKARDKT